MHTNAVDGELGNNHFNSIADVERALKKLDQTLVSTELEQLHNFTEVYRIITHNVRRNMAAGAFEHPEFLQKFDVRFAWYYFEALRRYVHDEETVFAWRIAFDAARSGRTSPLSIMALGVNAHINNDIPQVLYDCGAKDKHRKDYRRINAIIHASIDEAIAALHGTDKLLNPKQRPLRLPAKLTMSALAKLWRFSAWKNFRALQTGSLTREQLHIYSQKRAKVLMRMPM
ncbi:MAG TPA: DUF5995 family protein [Candidatus Saccharimonadales bacterium]|jgi:hypothetical protein